MKNYIRGIIISAALISTAYAQPGTGNGYSNVRFTYDVDIEMLGVQSTPVTISGDTTLASSCSAAFCAGYGVVDFRNSIDGTYFTQVPSGDGVPPFYDPKDHATLNFDFAGNWGSSGTLTDITLTEQVGSKTVSFTCGQGGVSCPLESMTFIKTTYAPELDVGVAGGAITLLLCVFAISTGSRTKLRAPSRTARGD
jgi:hypothetical protein